MNTKTLLICLTVLAVLLCSAQSLTFSGNQHKSQSHLAKVYAHRIAQKIMSYHLQTKDSKKQNETNAINVVLDMVVAQMANDPTSPQCFEKLSIEQKRRTAELILQTMSSVQNSNKEKNTKSSNEQVQLGLMLLSKIASDETLGQEGSDCLMQFFIGKASSKSV